MFTSLLPAISAMRDPATRAASSRKSSLSECRAYCILRRDTLVGHAWKGGITRS